MSAVLIIGASSAIGQALATALSATRFACDLVVPLQPGSQ